MITYSIPIVSHRVATLLCYWVVHLVLLFSVPLVIWNITKLTWTSWTSFLLLGWLTVLPSLNKAVKYVQSFTCFLHVYPLPYSMWSCPLLRLQLLFILTTFFPHSSFTLDNLLFKHNGQMCNFLVFMLSAAYRGKGVFFLPMGQKSSRCAVFPLCFWDLSGESLLCLGVQDALPMLCKNTLPLRLACPSYRGLCWLQTSYVISSTSWLEACHCTKINPHVRLPP